MKVSYLLISVLLLSSCGNSNDKLSFETYQSDSVAIDYRKAILGKYEKNAPILIKGEVIHANGKYLEVQPDTESTFGNAIILKFSSKPDLLSKDHVKIYARYEGNKFDFEDWLHTNHPIYTVDYYEGPSDVGNFPKELVSNLEKSNTKKK